MEKDLLVLGIETSCDETAAAVIKNGTEIVSNVVASQIESHKRFGGVVPELASRHHVEQITIVIEEAMQQAGAAFKDLDAIAVTEGPGLWVRCLLASMLQRRSVLRIRFHLSASTILPAIFMRTGSGMR